MMKIVKARKGRSFFIADRRICISKDRSRVVAETDPDVGYLYAVPGTRIPYDQAVRYGLVEEEKPKRKAAPKSKNKASKPEADKAE